MIIKDILLSILQGITEFLPVSSSGHLVITSKLTSADKDLLFFIILHVGTILSMVVFFYKDIIKALKDAKTVKNIMIVTFITGILGLAGKAFFQGLFLNYRFVTCMLFINGLILILSNKIISLGNKTKTGTIDSMLLGLSQAAAIIPGISRSGITISTLLLRKIDKEEAFRFSFLAAIPIIFASFAFEIIDSDIDPANLLNPAYIIGLITAFITGYFSLMILRIFIKRSRLDIFGYYCITISCVLWIKEMF